MKQLVIALFAIIFMSTTLTHAKSCKDFKTQKEAQNYFIKHKDKRLDRDGDGQACDCLPGGNGKHCPKKK